MSKKSPLWDIEHTGKLIHRDRSNWEIKILGLGKGELRRLPLTFPWIVHWGEFWSPGGTPLKPGTKKSKTMIKC